MAHPFLDRLARGPLLGDSAMGTMLIDLGHPPDGCLDHLNLTHPKDVAEVHRANILAGADFIETNTFGANRFRLATHNLADKVRDINRKAVRIAREEREIAGRGVLVAGSIGPIGKTIAPVGTVDPADATSAYLEQIEALLEGGVDFFLIETISNLMEMELVIESIRSVCDEPVVAMMTFSTDHLTIADDSPDDVARRLAELRVEVIGANCSVGPKSLLSTIKKIGNALPGTPDNSPYLAGMPNAGFPSMVNGRLIYHSTPDYFADFATNAIQAGARMVGGCCGTTPQHISAMRIAIDEMTGQQQPSEPESVTRSQKPPFTSDRADDTLVKQAMETNRFLKFVEIQPPKGLNPGKAIEGARLLRDAGVDGINVADSPMARVRMSAMTLCYLIQQAVGIETILHYTTRDRSLMGLQSELLGAHAAGVRNILALTGDPPSLGGNQGSTPVFDVDSIGLIKIIERMNRGEDDGGSAIGQPANFTIACAVDPGKEDIDEEVRRLRAKIEAGAHFVMTQPIYEASTWTNFLKLYGVERLPIPVMIGILPLHSTKHAELLYNELPGIRPTEEARRRMKLAGSDGRNEGIRMAQELLLELRQHAEGVYVMPSFGRYESAAEVISVVED